MNRAGGKNPPRSIFCKTEGRRLVLDFPRAVRLATGFTISLFCPSADRHGLSIFTAIFSRCSLIGFGRSDRPGVTAIWVFPGRSRSRLLVFKRVVRRLSHRCFVCIVERFTDLAAEQGTKQCSCGNGCDFTFAPTNIVTSLYNDADFIIRRW